MFTLSIALGRAQPMVWTLMFRRKEAAEAAVTTLRESVGTVMITDEFGQTFDGQKADVVGSLFENLEESRGAHVERALAGARVQAAVMSRVAADPALRQAAMMAGSPPVLSPIMNGRA